MSSSSEDDQPLRRSKPKAATNGVHGVSKNGNGKRPLTDTSDLSEDDRPLAKRVKAEPASSPPVPLEKSRKRKIAASDSGGSVDDVPLAMLSTKVPMPGAYAAAVGASSPRTPRRNQVKTYKEESDEEMVPSSPIKAAQGDDDEDPPAYSSESEPLVKKKAPQKKNGKATNGTSKPAAIKRKAKVESDAEASSEEDKPLASKKKVASPRKRVKKEEESDGDNASEDEKPAKKKRTSTKKRVKEDAEGADGDTKSNDKAKAVKKEKKPKADDDDPTMFKWWEEETPEDIKGDGTKKWETLRHSGVLFPPPYEPLPSNVKLLYDGKPVDLPPESEEVAGFFAAKITTEHAQDEIFQNNFFKDWQEVLAKHPPRNGIKIKKFEKCDFKPIADYIEAEKAKLKRMSKEEKKAAKEAKDKLEEPYTTCYLNGRPEKVGNFRLEPPGLFLGRGKHPRKGCLKTRLSPEDIIINIGKGEVVPTPNMPGKWRAVQHDDTVTWLANWKENVNGQSKYVFLAATSSIKGKSDRDKFEKARELKNHIDRIRKDYNADLKSKVMADRQRATAMYLIDKYALRAGNEKGEDEADTVGCCSLRCEHIILDKNGKVTLDFLGKDSVRYFKEIDDIDPQVFKNLRIFKGQDKKETDMLFDRVNTGTLNAHLRDYMKGLTAKVFRTYNASTLFERELLAAQFPPDAMQQVKVNTYNAANKEAAELCNHQRAVAKGFDAGMAKMALHTLYLKHQRMGYRRELFRQGPKQKKAHPEWLEPESDLEDDDAIQEFQDEYYEEKKKELEEAWTRAEKTLEDTGATPDEIKKRKLKSDEKLAQLEAEYAAWVKHRTEPRFTFFQFKREKGANEDVDTVAQVVEAEMNVQKLEKAITRSDETISKTKLKKSDKENLKTISLTTSKINYLDPRITAAFCARHNLNISLFFTKTLRKKFPWAMSADADWRF